MWLDLIGFSRQLHFSHSVLNKTEMKWRYSLTAFAFLIVVIMGPLFVRQYLPIFLVVTWKKSRCTAKLNGSLNLVVKSRYQLSTQWWSVNYFLYFFVCRFETLYLYRLPSRAVLNKYFLCYIYPARDGYKLHLFRKAVQDCAFIYWLICLVLWKFWTTDFNYCQFSLVYLMI